MLNLNLNLSAPAPDARPALDPKIFAQTAGAVRAWLETQPRVQEILARTTALELALAAHVKKNDAALFALVQDANARAENETQPDAYALETLAARLRLNLDLFAVTRAEHYRDAARKLTAHAAARFDDELGMFRENAPANADAFYADANAYMAEALYRAWRVLDDETLRPMPANVLGQVGSAFAPHEGLYQHVALSDETRDNTRHVPAYAAAMQMFLTTTETTGRGTYIIRARILADFVLARDMANAAHTAFDTRAQLADAFTRLYQFTHNDAYQNAAGALLQNTTDVPHNADAARFALAVEHAQNFPLHLVIIGDVNNDENARGMWHTALNAYASARAIETLDPQQHAARIQSLGYAHDNNAVAYVCRGPVCLPPVRSAE